MTLLISIKTLIKIKIALRFSKKLLFRTIHPKQKPKIVVYSVLSFVYTVHFIKDFGQTAEALC